MNGTIAFSAKGKVDIRNIVVLISNVEDCLSNLYIEKYSDKAGYLLHST